MNNENINLYNLSYLLTDKKKKKNKDKDKDKDINNKKNVISLLEIIKENNINTKQYIEYYSN
jgi:hypothetical protein